MPAHAPQAADDVREVAAEDAAIRVQLVDDDEAQVLEEFGPPRVVRQDARVQHVGIAEHDVRARADGPARVLRRIAVVGEDADVVRPFGADQLRELVQFRQLILRERFRREQVQRARRGVLQDAADDGRVVAERLPRCRRRDDHDVAARERVVDRLGLVRVELLDAARPEGAAQPIVERCRKRCVLGGHRGQLPHGRDVRIGRAAAAHQTVRVGRGERGLVLGLEPRQDRLQRFVFVPCQRG